jgi:hypothetical protein
MWGPGIQQHPPYYPSFISPGPFSSAMLRGLLIRGRVFSLGLPPSRPSSFALVISLPIWGRHLIGTGAITLCHHCVMQSRNSGPFCSAMMRFVTALRGRGPNLGAPAFLCVCSRGTLTQAVGLCRNRPLGRDVTNLTLPLSNGRTFWRSQ